MYDKTSQSEMFKTYYHDLWNILLIHDTDRYIILYFNANHSARAQNENDNNSAYSGHPLADNTKHDHDNMICNTWTLYNSTHEAISFVLLSIFSNISENWWHIHGFWSFDDYCSCKIIQIMFFWTFRKHRCVPK